MCSWLRDEPRRRPPSSAWESAALEWFNPGSSSSVLLTDHSRASVSDRSVSVFVSSPNSKQATVQFQNLLRCPFGEDSLCVTETLPQNPSLDAARSALAASIPADPDQMILNSGYSTLKPQHKAPFAKPAYLCG
ncbi:hypothetical protein AOLI_G00103570 [Acnodon oligacanthus]